MERQKRLPGQKEDETQEEYLARVEARVQERLNAEANQIPDRFNNYQRPETLQDQHPVFRTTNHDYGAVTMSDYERPTVYKTFSRHFTEKEHLGFNYEHGGMNL